MKKSQLKDRMLSATPQPVVRQDSNPSHHRSDSAPSLPSGKSEKFRSEVGVPSTRPDNGAVKFDPNKHRQRADSTCSAARTEIHHITKDPNKSNLRQQGEIFHASNHSLMIWGWSKVITRTLQDRWKSIPANHVTTRFQTSIPVDLKEISHRGRIRIHRLSWKLALNKSKMRLKWTQPRAKLKWPSLTWV